VGDDDGDDACEDGGAQLSRQPQSLWPVYLGCATHGSTIDTLDVVVVVAAAVAAPPR
jgi:hypothetical protein